MFCKIFFDILEGGLARTFLEIHKLKLFAVKKVATKDYETNPFARCFLGQISPKEG
jgi:hypothetical protein